MSNLTDQAERAAERLLKVEEEQLYVELGIRTRAVAKDPKKGGSFDPDVTYDGTEIGLLDDVRDFGKRLFRRWIVEVHKLACGSDPDYEKERKLLADKLGLSEVAVTAALTGILIANFGLAAAIASVIAALIVKLFFRPTYEEFCQVWKEKLPQEG